MATTTLMPLDPALSPQRIVRILTISADLLPEEMVGLRRARRNRGWIVVALVVVLALLAGWYVYADRKVRNADTELGNVTEQATTLQKSQSRYQVVVDVQTETGTISKELKVLLADDLPWAIMLNTLRGTGTDSGVTVSGVSALLNDKAAASAAASATLPSSSGAATIGTATITGGAPDKPSIAKYVDALGRLSIVANPYLTSATKGEKNWQYSIQVDITAATLCGRFTNKCKSSGGN
jgi:hypothetical protein